MRSGPYFTGPYHEPQRGHWRCVIYNGQGGRSSCKALTEEAARAIAEQALALHVARAPITCAVALDHYEAHLRDSKGGKPRAVATTLIRLRAYLTALVPKDQAAAELDRPLSVLTPSRAQLLYVAVSGRPCGGCKKVVPLGTPGCCPGAELGKARWAADTHRNVLAEVRTFIRWAMEAPRSWLSRDPLAQVKPVGKRHHGKPQLRLDDAELWLKAALRLADEGDEGAVGALMTMGMGLSGEEITGRKVRDLDAKGRVLHITDGKTEERRQPVLVPVDLQPLLLRAARGKLPEAPLFTSDRTGGHHWRDWPREQVGKICKLAGVPVVTAHGMRGLRATLEVLAGRGLEGAASALRHSDQGETAARSYVAPQAAAGVTSERVFRILRGGG